jgi:hypothetical protein
MTWTPMELGLVGMLAAPVATALGALPGRVPARSLLAGVAGLLLVLSVFSLGLPAARLLAPHLEDLSLVAGLMGGLVLGGFGFDLMRLLAVRTPPLLGLHNLPEGLAVGTALAATTPWVGLPALLGVTLHNLLDGALAAQLHPEGRLRAALTSSLPEVLGVALGVWLAHTWRSLVPWILLGTAGAMIEMVRTEVLPLVRGE